MNGPRLSRERVLVVDDDPSIGRLLEVMLGAEGYRCTRAETVAQASDAAAARAVRRDGL